VDAKPVMLDYTSTTTRMVVVHAQWDNILQTVGIRALIVQQINTITRMDVHAVLIVRGGFSA
jgi:hypothetical protein